MINILCPPSTLKLGRKGENEFRTIEFDVAPWLADYPNGSISVVYMRPDGVVYPPEVTTTNGVTSWVITSVDTAAAGAGYAEIRLIDGDVVGKSARINTMVYLAINGTEVAPPAPDWTVVAAQILSTIGNLDDLTTEDKSNLVAAINEAAQSGGGTDLPDVTIDDDGKVLKVIDGEWGVGDDSGGIPDAPSDGNQYARKDGAWSEVKYVVTVTETGGVFSADKTYNEIATAIANNTDVEVRYDMGEEGYYSLHLYTSSMGVLVFGASVGLAVDASIPLGGFVFASVKVVDNADVWSVGMTPMMKSTSISASSGDGEIPTAKAVYDALQGLDIPTQLSQLTGDSTHRTVTDAEKAAWNGKQDAITANGLLKGDGSGGVTAAVAGTDYLTLSTLPIYDGGVE